MSQDPTRISFVRSGLSLFFAGFAVLAGLGLAAGAVKFVWIERSSEPGLRLSGVLMALLAAAFLLWGVSKWRAASRGEGAIPVINFRRQLVKGLFLVVLGGTLIADGAGPKWLSRVAGLADFKISYIAGALFLMIGFTVVVTTLVLRGGDVSRRRLWCAVGGGAALTLASAQCLRLLIGGKPDKTLLAPREALPALVAMYFAMLGVILGCAAFWHLKIGAAVMMEEEQRRGAKDGKP